MPANAQKIAFSTQDPIDKIVAEYHGSFVANAGSSGAVCGTLQNIDSLDPAKLVQHSWFSQLMWSDDGVNWFPGGNPHNTLSAYNNNGQELTVISFVNSGSVYLYALNQRTTTPTIRYKLWLFDRSAY